MKIVYDNGDVIEKELTLTAIGNGRFCGGGFMSAPKASLTDGKIDIFVAGVGTGGTLSGVGKYLKEQNSDCRIVAVEPAASPLLSGGVAGTHGLQGIGANFIPENFKPEFVDKIIAVSEADSYGSAKELARLEGILCGITSGSALHVATELALRPENRGKTIVALLPDTGARYLSTPLFDE